MPLTIGTKNIIGIYKGEKEIDKVYKGTTLLYSWSWEQWYQEYVYNTLIPTTINSKNVKSRAKVQTIYGNSVVENQLVQNGNFESASGWTATYGTISVSNNVCTYTVSTVGNASQNRISHGNLKVVSGHKYLFVITAKSSRTSSLYLMSYSNSLSDYLIQSTLITNSLSTTKKTYCLIITGNKTANDGDIRLSIHSNDKAVGDTCEYSNIQLIDLTQMFPFDTPTTLDDVRVQAILNRGYIAYNTGTLKSVDMSEVSSEPFNVWDEEWEQGYINSMGVPSSAQRLRSKNFIKVVGGQEYCYYCSVLVNFNVFFYDNNYNFISSTTKTNSASNRTATIIIPNNVSYIKFYLSSEYGNGTFYNNDICINVSSSLNGTYKPYQAPQTLSLKYQGSGVNTSHDTMTIGNENVVFVKNMALVDLGTLSYSYSSATNSFWSTTLDTMIATTGNTTVCNMLCSKYQPISAYDLLSGSTNGVAFSMSGVSISGNIYVPHLRIRDTAYNDATTFKTAMSGVQLEYPLATTQTITIPRKRLGVVDLGSMSWEAQGSSRFVSRTIEDDIKPASAQSAVANIYCVIYKTTSYSNLNDNFAIAVYTDGRVYVKDTSKSTMTAQQFKESLNGIYLFYETNTDVPDITNTIQIQAGGTITTNSNVLPNMNFEVQCK